MRTNVTTPGGFFVGLGGIVAFCVVSSLVYLWVKNPAPNTDLRPQQAALGLAAAPDAPHDQVKKKKEETDVLLEAAAAKYNGGVKPDIDRLPCGGLFVTGKRRSLSAPRKQRSTRLPKSRARP